MTHRTAASRYARALFDIAQKEHQDLDTIERELAEFIDLLKQHPTFEQVLMNPAIPAPRKRAAVAAVIAGRSCRRRSRSCWCSSPSAIA